MSVQSAEVAGQASVAWWQWLFPPAGAKQLALFYRQLAQLLDGGVGLERSIELAGQGLGPGGRRIVADMLATVRSGNPLYEALQQYPHVFPWWHLEMIRQGELSGTLPSVLRELSAYCDERVRLRRSIISDLMYPSLVFLAFCFIPPFPALFLGQISFGQYLARALTPVLLVVGAIFAVYVAARLNLVNRRVRHAVTLVVNAVPAVGTALSKLALARFSLVLRALYVAGARIDQALSGAGRACGNEVYRSAAERAARAVARGDTLYTALADTRAFPQQFLTIVQSGEEAGALDDVLERLQRAYAEEGRMAIRTLSRIFTMSVYLLIVLLVAWQVISFWLGYAEQIRNVMP